MSSRFVGLFLTFTFTIGLTWPAIAQEAAGEAKPAEVADDAKIADQVKSNGGDSVGTGRKVSDDAKIADLVKQLDAEEFTARQDASKALEALGEKAVAALEKATASDSSEVSMRAFDILKGHFEKGTPTVKDSAKQALQRLSKADLGAASKRAGEVLNPPAPATPPTPIRPGFGRAVPLPAGGGIRIAGARVVIAGAAAGGGIETKIKIEDGVKTTEVKDKDRHVKIVDSPDKGLTLEVTETKDGKETTQKYEAKNAEDLKKNHAEAHKIYEQYAQKGAEIKIGGIIGAVPVAPGIRLPIAPGFAPAPRAIPVPLEPAAPAKKSLEGLDQLEKAIQDAESSLKELAKPGGDNDHLKQAQDRLEEVRKQLEKLRSSLK
jgi:hypothetical protein